MPNIKNDIIYKNAEHKIENSTALLRMYIKKRNMDAAIVEAQVLLDRLNILYEQLEK
jgi:hypothetical protein